MNTSSGIGSRIYVGIFLSLCDEHRNGQSMILDDDALKVVREEKGQTWYELTDRFQVFDENSQTSPA